MKIVVIDDDAQIRRMVTRVLSGAGYAVVTAADGIRGMAMVNKERPQLVVTDIFMPEQEGIETILELRRHNPTIKIIAMSGGGPIGGSDLLKMARLLGAHEVIEKPFRAAELLARVNAVCGQPRIVAAAAN